MTVEPLPPAAADAALADWLEDALREAPSGGALRADRAAHCGGRGGGRARLGIPYVVELNAPLPEEAARYRRLDRPQEAELLERAVLSSADVVLAVSGPLAPTREARRDARRGTPERRRSRALLRAARRARAALRVPRSAPPLARGRTCSPRAGGCSGRRRRPCSSSGTGRARGARGDRRGGDRGGAARAGSARCSRLRRSASRRTRRTRRATSRR